jgi:hypothetical protein
MNPLLLTILRTIGPYVVAAGIGFYGAWQIQGVRIDSARNDLVAFKNDVAKVKAEELAKHAKINEETADAWSKGLAALQQCYQSGRCRVPVSAGGGSPGISAPAVKPDGAGESPVPSPARVAQDCAEDELKLNLLQNWIERIKKD